MMRRIVLAWRMVRMRVDLAMLQAQACELATRRGVLALQAHQARETLQLVRSQELHVRAAILGLQQRIEAQAPHSGAR